MSARRRSNMDAFTPGTTPLLDRVAALVKPSSTDTMTPLPLGVLAAVGLEQVGREEHRTPPRPPISGPYVVALIGAGRRRVEVHGHRVIEALRVIVEKGSAGCTAMDFGKAVRVADNMYKLRHRYGVPIVTTREQHDLGEYGRYRLSEPVTIIEPASAEVAA